MNLRLPLIGAIALAVVPAFASINFSDDFNAENGGVGQLNFYGLSNWDVTRGSVDLIPDPNYDFYPGNGLYLDLDGSTGEGGRIESKQTFDIHTGDSVSFSFDWGNNPGNGGNDNDADVYFGSYLITHLHTNDANMPLTHFSIGGISPGEYSGKLIFDMAGGDNQGIILDNVCLHSQAVPEPASYAVFGLGILGLVVRRKRA